MIGLKTTKKSIFETEEQQKRQFPSLAGRREDHQALGQGASSCHTVTFLFYWIRLCMTRPGRSCPWVVLSGCRSQNTVRSLYAFRKESRAHPSHASTLGSQGVLRSAEFLKPSDEMCWCDDAPPCTRVLLASGAIPLGFRASHPCSMAPCTDLQTAQRLQLPSILERKEDFTLLAERLGAELTFGAEDNTSLFSQMGLSWVPHSAQAFTLFQFKQH